MEGIFLSGVTIKEDDLTSFFDMVNMVNPIAMPPNFGEYKAIDSEFGWSTLALPCGVKIHESMLGHYFAYAFGKIKEMFPDTNGHFIDADTYELPNQLRVCKSIVNNGRIS